MENSSRQRQGCIDDGQRLLVVIGGQDDEAARKWEEFKQGNRQNPRTGKEAYGHHHHLVLSGCIRMRRRNAAYTLRTRALIEIRHSSTKDAQQLVDLYRPRHPRNSFKFTLERDPQYRYARKREEFQQRNRPAAGEVPQKGQV